MRLERRTFHAVARRVGVFARLQQPVEGHHAAHVQAAAHALDHGHAAEAVADGAGRRCLVHRGMREPGLKPLAKQRSEQLVVVIHGDEAFEALLLEVVHATRIVREDAFRRRHDVAVDVDGETHVADSGQVLGDVDIEELEPLVVVDDEHEGAWTDILGWCDQVAKVGLAAEVHDDVVTPQVGRGRPEVR